MITDPMARGIALSCVLAIERLARLLEEVVGDERIDNDEQIRLIEGCGETINKNLNCISRIARREV